MTVQIITLPGVSDDDQRTLNGLLQQLSDKAPRNRLRESYYDGKRALETLGTIIPPSYQRLAIVLGWSAKAVDTLADRCNLDGFVWADGDLNSLGLSEVMDGNFLDTEISGAITQSFLHGASFLVNSAGDTSADEPAGMVHVKDANNATGVWDSRARRLTSLLSITGRGEDDSITSLALYLYNRTIAARKDPDTGIWSAEPSEHPWGVPAEPLVYKYRTGRPFGYSRISRPVMSLHDQALRTVIRMEGHADVYSWPEMWLLGADEAVFKNPDGTPKAAWQVMLGRIKAVPDDEDATHPRADVKQFAASSPQPHIDQLKQQAQMFSGETSIPLTSLGVSDMSNPTSADSYIASREDLIARAEAATDGWSRPLRRTITRALAMQNGLREIPPEWLTISPKWRSPLYLSRAQEADAGAKQIGAVSWLAETEVGLELLGLDAQQVSRALAERRRVQSGALVDRLLAQPAPVSGPPADAVAEAAAAEA